MSAIKLVVFDMDGTLLEPRSCWAYIHDHFGTDNSDMLQQYLEHKISDQEFVKADIKLWENTSEKTINEEYINSILDEIKPIEGAEKLIDELHRKGIKTAIISGGIQYLANKWADRWKMEFAIANELINDKNGKLKAIINASGNAKGPIMDSLLKRMELSKDEVVSIGDTVVDLPLFERSFFSIAVNTADSKIINCVDYHHLSPDLSDLIPIITKLAKR